MATAENIDGPKRSGQNLMAKLVGAPKVEQVARVHDADVVRFIPVSRSNVMAKLLEPGFFDLEAWPEADANAVEAALHYIGRLRQQDSAIKLDELMDGYHPFNPDNDMEYSAPMSDWEKDKQREKFISGVEQLVFRANFEYITRAELERVLAETSPYGVDVDIDVDEFEPLLPYFRGVKMQHRAKRDWRWGYLRFQHFEVPSYERLFLALTLKPAEQRIEEIMAKEDLPRKQAERKFKRHRRAMPDWVSPDHIYLKMFKDIPQIDIDMLLPNNGVKFRAFDRIMLWVSGGGSAIYALVISIVKLVAMVVVSPVLLLMTLFGFGGTLFRQIMSVINTRNRYMMELVQKLYFHNISNNQGALTLLVDEAEEEDIKEDTLLYAFLLRQLPFGLDLDKAKSDIEAFLSAKFKIKVNFDHDEALGRLKKRGLAGQGEDGAVWVARPAQAVKHLQALWGQSLDLRAGCGTILDKPEPETA
jgi:hypothetical protein